MIPLTIRPATPADLDDIFILYKLATEEVSSWGGYPLQKESSAWMSSFDALKTIIWNGGNAQLWVAEAKVVVGFGLATVETLDRPYKPLKIAKSVFTYILPEYRGGDTAKRLVQAKIDWAKERGAHSITAYTTDANRSRILMERGGFKKLGYELEMKL